MLYRRFPGLLRVRLLLDGAQTAVLAALIALILNTFVLQVTDVRQNSMRATLDPGDRLVVLRSGLTGDPRRGEVITFHLEDQPLAFVKRVIGLPGDLVELRAGRVWVNGVLIEEPYAPGPTIGLKGPLEQVRVTAGHYYVLGDNRTSSNDSRTFGLVPAERVIGVAVVRFWPVDRVRLGF